MDAKYIFSTIVKLLPYTLVTLEVVLQAFVLGCIFGGLLAWAKLGKRSLWRKIAYGYTTMIRCTPFIIMLFLVFYGSPYLLLIWNMDANVISKKVYAVIALTMYTSSNLSDNFKAAYLSVSKGQREAALCVAMTEFQAFRRIILPQMIFIVLPMVSNVVVSEIQDTALAFTIGLVDLMGQAKIIDALGYNVHTLPIYTAAALIFWGLAIVCEKIIKFIHDDLGTRKKLDAYGRH